MEEQKEVQNVKRPWQGTTWAWLNIVGISILSIFVIVLFLGFAGAGIFLENLLVQEGLSPATFAAGIFVLLFIIFVPLLVLEILLIVGFFKGWKWAVIVAIIFESLSVICSLFTLRSFEDLSFLILGGFMLYLAIFCVQDPFYNQKK